MESNERGGRSRWLDVELSYFAMIKISPRREERYDRDGRGGDEGKREREVGEGERRMQVQPAPVRDGRTDVRADEGGIEL